MYASLIAAAALGLAVPAQATAVVESSPIAAAHVSNGAAKGDSLPAPWTAKADMLPVSEGLAPQPETATVAFLTAQGQSVAVRIPVLLVSVE